MYNYKPKFLFMNPVVEQCQVCNEPSKFTCAGCTRRFYCSTRCQTIDWELGHASKCRDPYFSSRGISSADRQLLLQPPDTQDNTIRDNTRRGSIETVRKLLLYGAYPSWNYKLDDALRIARETGHSDIEQLLLSFQRGEVVNIYQRMLDLPAGEQAIGLDRNGGPVLHIPRFTMWDVDLRTYKSADVFASHYNKVVKNLGSGSYGTVFHMKDEHNQDFAIKFLVSYDVHPEFEVPQDVEIRTQNVVTKAWLKNQKKNIAAQTDIDIPVIRQYDYGIITVDDQFWIDILDKPGVWQDIHDHPNGLRNSIKHGQGFTHTIRVIVMELAEMDLSHWIETQFKGMQLRDKAPEKFTKLRTLISHVLAGLHLLGEAFGFSHYDLHLKNVLLVRVQRQKNTARPNDAIRLSINGSVYEIPFVDGYIAKISDFGMCHIEDRCVRPRVASDGLTPNHFATLAAAYRTYNPAFDLYKLIEGVVYYAIPAFGVSELITSEFALFANLMLGNVADWEPTISHANALFTKASEEKRATEKSMTDNGYTLRGAIRVQRALLNEFEHSIYVGLCEVYKALLANISKLKRAIDVEKRHNNSLVNLKSEILSEGAALSDEVFYTPFIFNQESSVTPGRVLISTYTPLSPAELAKRNPPITLTTYACPPTKSTQVRPFDLRDFATPIDLVLAELPNPTTPSSSPSSSRSTRGSGTLLTALGVQNEVRRRIEEAERAGLRSSQVTDMVNVSLTSKP